MDMYIYVSGVGWGVGAVGCGEARAVSATSVRLSHARTASRPAEQAWLASLYRRGRAQPVAHGAWQAAKHLP